MSLVGLWRHCCNTYNTTVRLLSDCRFTVYEINNKHQSLPGYAFFQNIPDISAHQFN